jgi:hypothetical protein
MPRADQATIDLLIDYFDAMEAKNFDRLGSYYADDVSLTFANAPTRATSSLRRRAPAKPISNSARPRTSARRSPRGATIVVTSLVRAAFTLRGAMPWRRRIPDQTASTPASAVGVSNPAIWWATLMEASRRRMVDGRCVCSSAARYEATVRASAGNGWR